MNETTRTTHNDTPVLVARGVARTFETTEGPLAVLTGIDLQVARGETIAITGPSGVGKSTLLHILGGLDHPTNGEVTIAGSSLAGQSEAALARFRNKTVGFVFQFHYLLEDFTAQENVMIPILLAGRSRAEASRRAELLLDQIGLGQRRTHRPRQLSGGEQQRVAVARALANSPELVLADEPSGNLDPHTGRMLHELLFRLNAEQQITFVIATHNRELAERSNRELRMVEGSLLS